MSGVVIIGAGPAGYACALGLASYGVPSTLLEQNEGIAAGSRATGISRRSLQLLTPCGVADRVMDVAVVQRANQAFVGERELFLDWTPKEPGRYPRVVNLQQDLFEEMLQEAVNDVPLIDVRWGQRVTDVHTAPAFVELDLAGASPEAPLRADWVVACDGARSGIRRAQGLKLGGVRYDTRFVVVDVRARLDVEHGIRRIWFDPPSNPGGTVIMHEQTRDVWRIDFSIGPGEDHDAVLLPEAVHERVAAHLALLGDAGDWEIVWSGDYTASSVRLNGFRHGRVLFAGDAAHLVPIFGGRGLNSAVEDGFNLAWKLAAAVQDPAYAAVLDTYSDERIEGADQNSAKAGIGAEVIAARSPGSLLLRQAALGLMQGARPALKTLLGHRTTDANTYTRPELIVGDGIATGARPGTALPDQLVDVEGRGQMYLSDALHPGFALLTVRSATDLPAPSLPAGRKLMGLPLHALAIDDQLHDELDAPLTSPLAPGTYLVRPDRYVMAFQAGGDPDELLAAAERHLSRMSAVHEVAT